MNYKEYKIGVLDFVDGIFTYNSLVGEKQAMQKYVGLVGYDLLESCQRQSVKLFDFFVTNFLEDIKKRKDIFEKIGKNAKNDYEILEKFCKLKFDRFGFWLSKD